MTELDRYRRTAMNWLMAKATGSSKFKNEVVGDTDYTHAWEFGACDNTDVESWIESAAEIIRDYYEGSQGEP